MTPLLLKGFIDSLLQRSLLSQNFSLLDSTWVSSFSSTWGFSLSVQSIDSSLPLESNDVSISLLITPKSISISPFTLPKSILSALSASTSPVFCPGDDGFGIPCKVLPAMTQAFVVAVCREKVESSENSLDPIITEFSISDIRHLIMYWKLIHKISVPVDTLFAVAKVVFHQSSQALTYPLSCLVSPQSIKPYDGNFQVSQLLESIAKVLPIKISSKIGQNSTNSWSSAKQISSSSTSELISFSKASGFTSARKKLSNESVSEKKSVADDYSHDDSSESFKNAEITHQIDDFDSLPNPESPSIPQEVVRSQAPTPVTTEPLSGLRGLMYRKQQEALVKPIKPVKNPTQKESKITMPVTNKTRPLIPKKIAPPIKKKNVESTSNDSVNDVEESITTDSLPKSPPSDQLILKSFLQGLGSLQCFCRSSIVESSASKSKSKSSNASKSSGRPKAEKVSKSKATVTTAPSVSVTIEEVKKLISTGKLEKYTIAQLKAILKDFGLKVGGKKAELLGRITEYTGV
ncbi:hypothetical protein GEMRC1_011327 [Eukaryota sp. GEM-RC1]